MAQLKSTNITGNLAVTGNILASKIIKLGGTNDDILMGDGSFTSKQGLIDSLETAMEGDTNTWREIKVNDTSILGTGIDTGSLNLKAGTNVSISSSGGTVTISSSYEDKGATSIEVEGTGNAVTTASYDAEARKITLTKGGTFLTSHQSLAAYVQGPSTSTDNAIVRFNGTGGKTVQNSTVTISDGGHLNIDTTSDNTMTTPAINVIHTGPANGSSTADLMILGGYKSAPYGFKFSTYGDGTAIIQSQRISGGSGEKFSLSLNPSGGDVLINGSKAATQAWVEGLGYITGSYLPLAGGTMTGTIKYDGATREIISFAPTNVTWRGGLKYSWTSNTTIGLWGKHANSQFVWHAGTDFSTTDVNGTSTRTYDFQVGRDVRTGGSGNLEALLGGKPLATQEWVEGKGYLTSHQSLSGYVTGSGLTENYLVLGNGGSSIKKGTYRITTELEDYATNAYIPTAEAVDTFVSSKLSGVSGSDKKTSSSSKADTELKLVGAVTASTDGVETFTNPNCYIGTDNCLYSNGKKVATEEWVETAIKDKISSVTIYSEILYDANGSVSSAVWTPGWRVDTGTWDPSVKSNNSAATYTMAKVTSSNWTVTLRRPYSPETTHSRWVMEVAASGMHGLSISGAGVATVADNKYKLQFAATANQTITLSKGEATFTINIVFSNASYQD